jgi:signal transduction histidine kinase
MEYAVSDVPGATLFSRARWSVRGWPHAPATVWFRLFAGTRAVTAIIAALLLLLRPPYPSDELLVAVGLVYSATSILVLARTPALQRSPWVWIVDGVAVLGLIGASGDWRSPYYLLALSALILPTTSLPPRRGLEFGGALVLGYVAVSAIVGVDWHEVLTTSRLESYAAHVMVPLLITTALVYGAELLRSLELERAQSERLALEAERQRIAWELHDSAKQRIHAAHLVLSARPRSGDASDRAVDHALRELGAASADMDTSLAELREPLFEAATLGDALRQWGDSLAEGSDARIQVIGDAPALGSFVAAHTYRIGREAMINAVRHADARNIEVVLRADGQRVHLAVADDGRGMPAETRPGANGIRSMRGRAQALGGELHIKATGDGKGTVVALHAPLHAFPLGTP